MNKTQERTMVRVAVYLVLINEKKILLQRRFNTGWMDGKYSLPSGHVEGHETIFDALIRETKEETGLLVKEKDLEIVHIMHRTKSDFDYIDFFVLAKNWSGEPKIIEPEKCDDLSWFSLDNLPDNLLSNVIQAVSKYYKKEFFSEFDHTKF